MILDVLPRAIENEKKTWQMRELSCQLSTAVLMMFCYLNIHTLGSLGVFQLVTAYFSQQFIEVGYYINHPEEDSRQMAGLRANQRISDRNQVPSHLFLYVYDLSCKKS